MVMEVIHNFILAIYIIIVWMVQMGHLLRFLEFDNCLMISNLSRKIGHLLMEHNSKDNTIAMMVNL